MLVLTRRNKEEIIIDGSVRIVVLAVEGNRARIGIIAPPSVRVDRKEIHDQYLAVPTSETVHNSAEALAR